MHYSPGDVFTDIVYARMQGMARLQKLLTRPHPQFFFPSYIYESKMKELDFLCRCDVVSLRQL